MSDQERDILTTLSQGRNAQAKHVQAKIQIAPEAALHHTLFKVAVGSCEDADIDGYPFGAAYRPYLLFLQGTQHLGLQIDGQFSDFIEKNCSAFGHGHQSIFGLICAGECAFYVSKQFAFNQSRHQRSAIDRDERLIAERAGIVDGAGDHLLAGAAFPQNENRMDTVGSLRNNAVELLHLRCTTDDSSKTLFRFHFLAEHAVL